MDDGLEREPLVTETWAATRIGTIYQVRLKDGRIKYNVQVVDEGREKPFVDKFFKYEEQARHFLYHKLMTTQEVRN
jgi:hypothetical protein